MLLSKLISVAAIAVLVCAEGDSDVPRVRSKRTIGVVLRNVGDLFGFDVFRRPNVAGAVPQASGTIADNVRKSFTINLNWNKNRTHANIPAAAPAAAPAPAAAAAPAARPAAAPAAPAAAPARPARPARPVPAAAPAPPAAAAPAAPAPAAPPAPAAAPAPKPVPAAAGLTTAAPPAPPRPSGPPTKAQLYVEYVDNNGNAREAQEAEDDDDDDAPKRIQIGLPDYSSVDYNEVKRDLANNGNNDFDHSREKFKQEFNNFWDASPWTVEHGYKFIVPQGPGQIVEAIPQGAEIDLQPKKNNVNVRSLKIVHNVKVYHQPTKTETYNDAVSQNYNTPESPQQQLHILDEEGVRYIVHQNGKKQPLPNNINAQLLEFYKKKFQADAAAQKQAAREGQQNAIQSNEIPTTSAPIIYTTEQIPVIYVPPAVIKEHIEKISKPLNYPNEQPEITKERHIYKVNHYRNDENPYNNYAEQPETVREPEYLNIKEKVEAGPPLAAIKISPHENLNSYIANARPGQLVKIKIVEPASRGADVHVHTQGHGDSEDVHRNVQKEKENVVENHERTEAKHLENSDTPKSKIPTFTYPDFNIKEYENIGYPGYDDPKDQDFFRGFSDEEKKNLEDHYHFFSSDHDPRGRDKTTQQTKTSSKDDKNESANKELENVEKAKLRPQKTYDDYKNEAANEKEHERDEKTEIRSQKPYHNYNKEGFNEKAEAEDDDEETKVPKKVPKQNVDSQKENKEDAEEDEDDRPQNIQKESEAAEEEEEEDDEEERPLVKKENVAEADDEEEDDDEQNGQHINSQAKKENVVEADDGDEDEDGDEQNGQRLKSAENEKAREEEEEDEDEEEVEPQSKITEKENLNEEDEEVEDEEDESEDRPKAVEKENVNEEEDDEDEEVENEDRPKAVDKESIIEEEEEDDDDDEVEDEPRPKAVEKENLNEEEDEDEDEVENDDEETKQRPKIAYNNIKENFDVETFDGSTKPRKIESEHQQQASNQNDEKEAAEPSTEKEDFTTELDSFINAHFKGTKIGANGEKTNEEQSEAKKAIRNRLNTIEKAHEKEFDDLFSKLGDGMEYEDFYKQFNRESKFIPSKQNLIDAETKSVRSKESPQPESTVVQPLYSGVLHAPAVQELFKSDKPLTVPFDHDYSASEMKSLSTQHRSRRSAQSSEEEDEEETAINEFKDESQYVPDTYDAGFDYKAPEPKMPDFTKLEAKQYKDDDTLSPKAYVTRKEDGQKTTWINIEVPVTYTTNIRT